MFSDSKLSKIFDELSINVPQKLLETAFTHSSKTFEDSKSENYERLEFLGDSVLKLIMSEILYKTFPDYDEGRMTKIRSILVSDANLSKISREINLQEHLILSKNEQKDGGREKDSVIACCFEAVLGAIYLTEGIEKSAKYLQKLFGELVFDVDKNLELYNAKAVLQEYTQGKTKDLPQYIEVSQTGKAHDKTFTYAVMYEGKELSTGSGKTKKDAQQEAAKKACIKLGILSEVKDV